MDFQRPCRTNGESFMTGHDVLFRNQSEATPWGEFSLICRKALLGLMSIVSCKSSICVFKSFCPHVYVYSSPSVHIVYVYKAYQQSMLALTPAYDVLCRNQNEATPWAQGGESSLCVFKSFCPHVHIL